MTRLTSKLKLCSFIIILLVAIVIIGYYYYYCRNESWADPNTERQEDVLEMNLCDVFKLLFIKPYILIIIIASIGTIFICFKNINNIKNLQSGDSIKSEA